MVYLVRGSEDGTIGIYRTKTKAWKRALEYMDQYTLDKKMLREEKAHLMEKGYAGMYHESSGVNARIESFVLE